MLDLQQLPDYDEFDLYPMNESTPFGHHPYKPKQHFTHYNKFRDIQTACHNHIQPIDQNLSRTISKKNSQQKQSSDHETITALAKIRNKKFPSSTIVNIPCLVCGDRSSGVHYGVNTCEGCKGFFRRFVAQQMSLRCDNVNNCKITLLNRNFCQYCRLKKCIDVGMSRDASRIGRPPKSSRAKTTNMMDSIKNRKQTTALHRKDKQMSSINHRDSVSSTTSNSIFPNCLFQHRLVKFTSEIHQEILRKLTTMLIYQERLLTNIETNEIDHITEMIINAHLQFSVYTFEKIRREIEKNPPIWPDSISDDPNCNPTSEWIHWQSSLPFESILQIFKSYSFFQQISQNDQICLFRYGIFETILVSWFFLFDIEPKSMLAPDFLAYMNRDFIKTIKTLGLFMVEIFDLGMKANHFRWKNSDIALFNALLMMNPERPGLCDKENIEQMKAKLMQVLYRHFRRHYPNETNRFLNVLQLIPTIQEINQIHLNAIGYIKRHEPSMFNCLPDFHREIYEDFSSQENNF